MSSYLQELVHGIRNGDRRLLAKALSLVESTKDEDAMSRDELLDMLLPFSGNARRIGVTGAPGVGKSTLIESFGCELIRRKHRVAVLAIDPSSSQSGGSILGDKVRMPELARSMDAFIRPSPSGKMRGGTAQRTRECSLVCEAAGFDTIIIETVGVGQAEYSIASMVDLFILLLLPNAGDDVQAVKRGIMEMADMFIITKSDISLPQTNAALATLKSVASLLRPRFEAWHTEIIVSSALQGTGIDALCDSCESFFTHCRMSIDENRKLQRGTWFDELLTESIRSEFLSQPLNKENYVQLKSEVVQSKLAPAKAIRTLLVGSKN